MWASMSVGESGLPTAGATVSHYRVLSALGVGGMGAVYLAEDSSSSAKVALKFLKKTGDAHGVSRLLREAETASALDHPNIATIYEIGEWNGQPFIAMAFVPGETLLQRLRRGPMTIDEIAGVGAQIASGLAAAHEVGIVHRDLKPTNVMLTPTGQVKILDFGLARNVSPDFDTMTRLTTEQTTVGTLAYMRPRTAQQRGCGSARRSLGPSGSCSTRCWQAVRPFDATTPAATGSCGRHVADILRQGCAPRNPVEIEQLIGRALERERARRTVIGRRGLRRTSPQSQRVIAGRFAVLSAAPADRPACRGDSCRAREPPPTRNR